MDRIEKIQKLDFLILAKKKNLKQLKSQYIKCNTIDMKLNTDLYRIMSYEMLIKSLKTESLSMSKPKTWPDPYETFLLNYKARMKDGSIVRFEKIKNKIYCQCWSLREECEGLWKAHTDQKSKYRSVRIKANANKLMEYFYDINNDFHYLSYFIGKVTYVKEEAIINLLKNGIGQYFSQMSSYMALISTLLIKRKAFDYEDEVRLIFNVNERRGTDRLTVINKWDLRKNCFTYKIDINDVIEEITFHPYLDEREYKAYKQEIIALGYKGKINHSDLYTRKNIIIDY